MYVCIARHDDGVFRLLTTLDLLDLPRDTIRQCILFGPVELPAADKYVLDHTDTHT